jgi:hypothetical protein
MLVLGSWGCQGRPEGFEKYVPTSESARAAIAAMLDAWRCGQPVDDAVGTRPVINVVDKHRRIGQTLKAYEILGEVSTDNARGFAVRLTLENPDESQLVRFLVVGIDPLLVFRQEDYELIAHWMHPMDESRPEGAEANAKP